jgi:hypothetical protein
MNGKPHDDPALDIIQYGLPVFSPEVDGLVRELGSLMEFRRLQELLEPLQRLPVEELGAKLTAKVAELREDGRERGWEV